MMGRRIKFVILFILLGALLGGCADKVPASTVTSNELIKNDQPQQNNKPSSPTASSGQDTMIVTVYNATDDARYLVAEPHVIPKTEQPAKAAMELLVAGTKM